MGGVGRMVRMGSSSGREAIKGVYAKGAPADCDVYFCPLAQRAMM